jgi:hypothetical protein
MTSAAAALLATWDDGQRRAACGPAPGPVESDTDRTRWFYTPTLNGGLSLQDQTPPQRQLTKRLVASGLSEAGFTSVAGIIGLENVLDRLEGWRATWDRDHGRSPTYYWVALFGDPEGPAWGWRFGGHHVSLNYVVVDGAVVSSTPSFLGADPLVSPLPAGGSHNPLGRTEEVARELVRSLDDSQLEQAVLLDRAPSDIISGNRPQVRPGDEMIHMDDVALWGREFDDPRLRTLVATIDHDAETATGYDAVDHAALALTREPRGVAGARLDAAQRDLLAAVVGAYTRRAPEDLWVPEDLDEVHFAWAGPVADGGPTYYRLQGPGLLAEYDNTQRDANHAHSVWRDPERDFGGDVLRAHLERHHGRVDTVERRP